MKPNRDRSVLSSSTAESASNSERDCGASGSGVVLGHRPLRRIPAAEELDPAMRQLVMQRTVDDSLQIARPRRSRVDAMVDVDPRLGRPGIGVHGEPVAAVPHRHSFCAVQRGEIVVVELPHHAVHLRTVERLDCRDAALVDQPVVVGQCRRTGISGAGAAPRHLVHAQVRPVREVAVAAGKHSIQFISERLQAPRIVTGRRFS